MMNIRKRKTFITQVLLDRQFQFGHSGIKVEDLIA